MRYAFMSFSCPDLDLPRLLETASRYGYQGVEPRIDAGHAHGIERAAGAEERRRARQAAERAGIALCCIATSCRYADPDLAAEQVKQTLAAVDLAADVGAPAVRVFGGAIPKSIDRERATEFVVRALGSVADHAAGRGVTVCMETHDSWCDPAHVAEVMRRVDHPAIAVNWDIMHPVRVAGASMDNAFNALRRWVRHVHFHDGRTRDGKLEMLPIGKGEIDHRRAVALLRDAGYDGFLSGEWIKWEPWETHLPRELAAMQRYERGKP